MTERHPRNPSDSEPSPGGSSSATSIDAGGEILDAGGGRTVSGASTTASGRAAVIYVVVVALGMGYLVGRCSAPTPGDAVSDADASTEAVWTCSMHPQVRQPQPGRCPLCSMDLIPLEAEEGSDHEPDRVTLSARARRMARVRTTPVRRLEAAGVAVRLLGRVDYDEATLETLTAWVGGRIERLHLDVTGVRVRRGQIVATLYSPEVYAAQQDLIAARRQVGESAEGTMGARMATSGLEAVRQRLRLLGVPDAELRVMERASRPGRNVPIRASASGTVIERIASEGAYVETGAPLYRLADLTRLWVLLDAYERDLPHLAVGQSVRITFEAVPGEVFEGRVAFVDPVIDPRRRTSRVRIAIANPERRLRPGMFAEATVDARRDSENSQPLVIPASAPLFTGRRSIVYVAVAGSGRPTYEVREVRLGPRAGDVYPIVAGLNEGDEVVTEGAFAIDADLQLSGGRSMMTRSDDTQPSTLPLPIEVPREWAADLMEIVASYLAVASALAEDDQALATRAAGELAQTVESFAPTEPGTAVAAWEPLGQRLRMHAQSAATSESIEELRARFEPLSAEISTLLRTFGNPTDVPLRLAHCPMAFDNRGAAWVQSSPVIDNAYFGSAMRTCGSIRATIGPGEYLRDEPEAAP